MSRGASTHTEIYRPFEGRLQPHPLRFLPLVGSQIRVLQKKKLPLLLLFGGPAIAGIALSFVVYGKFSAEARFEAGDPSMPNDLKSAALMAAAQTMASSLLEVRNLIAMANVQIQFFALLAIGWFGAGLIAEDKKLGAHLLYFSRPMTKLDYFLGHFLTVSWFGLIAMLGPGLLICIVATFTSPDYSFIKEEWGVVLATIANAVFTVGLLAVMTLAISSMAKRKSFALIAIVGLVSASMAVGGVLTGLQNDMNWMMFGFWNNVIHVGDWFFDTFAGPSRVSEFEWDPNYSLAICGGLAALSLAILWWQLREIEGVGVVAVLEADKLGRWYGQVVGLNELTVSVDGGITGLVGPNGAGKSTFLKLVAGEIKPSRGSLEVLGEPFANREYFRRIGFCPQQDALYDDMTGPQVLTFLLRLSGYGAREARQRADRTLDRVGLKEGRDRPTRTYSKGMRQRVKLAQAIAHEPELVIADEPLTGLDPVGRAEMTELFRELADQGVHALVSSHVLHEVQSITSEIVLLHRGRLLAQGDVGEVRSLLNRHPRRVDIAVRDGRRLAQRLVAFEDVLSVRFVPEEERLTVETRNLDRFQEQFTRTAAEERAGVRTLESSDASLEAVFDYLVG